jgi:5-methylcytosine-specific restriction endonuclease McrA
MPTGVYQRKHTIWNKGKTGIFSDESRKRISEALKKRVISDITRIKISKAHKGLKRSLKAKKNISTAQKKRFLINPPWNKGKKLSKEHIDKLSSSHIGLNCGKKHPNWRGGFSKKDYPSIWRETLKKSIRERDNYTCQVCFKIQSSRSFDVHHIDYNKKNCNPVNLITLCKSCHTKTTLKRRYWILFLNKKNNGK